MCESVNVICVCKVFCVVIRTYIRTSTFTIYHNWKNKDKKLHCELSSKQVKTKNVISDSLVKRDSAVPVEALAVADVRVPPGERHQDVPELLDAAGAGGGVVLVVGQRAQQVQLDLLGGRVGFVPGHVEQRLVVVGRQLVSELPHVEGDAPAPQLRAVLVGDAAADQGFELGRAHQVSVHGAGQVVLPLHPHRHLLVRHGQGPQLQSPHLGHQLLLLLLLLRDRLEAEDVVLAENGENRFEKTSQCQFSINLRQTCLCL